MVLTIHVWKPHLHAFTLRTAFLDRHSYRPQVESAAKNTCTASKMDEDTKVVIIGFSVLGLIALVCLIVIGVTTVRFLRSEEAATVSLKAGLRDDGKKGHRVSAAALSSI